MVKNKKKKPIIKIIMSVITLIVIIVACKSFIEYLFPLKYADLIKKYSSQYNLDPYLVAAVINVESRYDPFAISNRDAKGLMQVKSSTGEWAADKIGIKNFREDTLYIPEINIKIGCWYLNYIDSDFNFNEINYDIVSILSAYNAGSSNVKKWINENKNDTLSIKIEQIPFEETRQYVKKVLYNIKIYKYLYPSML